MDFIIERFFMKLSTSMKLFKTKQVRIQTWSVFVKAVFFGKKFALETLLIEVLHFCLFRHLLAPFIVYSGLTFYVPSFCFGVVHFKS